MSFVHFLANTHLDCDVNGEFVRIHESRTELGCNCKTLTVKQNTWTGIMFLDI